MRIGQTVGATDFGIDDGDPGVARLDLRLQSLQFSGERGFSGDQIVDHVSQVLCLLFECLQLMLGVGAVGVVMHRVGITMTGDVGGGIGVFALHLLELLSGMREACVKPADLSPMFVGRVGGGGELLAQCGQPVVGVPVCRMRVVELALMLGDVALLFAGFFIELTDFNMQCLAPGGEFVEGLLSIGELALRGDVSCLGILQPCFDSGNVEVVGASGIMFRGGNQGSEVGRKEYELL